MVWSHWKAKTVPNGGIFVAGLDLNATRARGAFADPGTPARPLLLADPDEELPLALSLENRSPQVTAKSLAYRRASPHLLCAGFLPYLGQPRNWVHGRHKLDAHSALAHVAEKLKSGLNGVSGVEVCLPAYLTASQIKLARSSMESAKLPVLGTIALPLALATLNPDAPRGLSLILDADDQLACWSLIETDSNHHHLKANVPLTNSGIRAWVDRLVDFVSDRCVRLCRRDPRDSAAAEQSLDDQLTEYLANSKPGQPLALSLRTEHWFQNLVLTWDEIVRATGSLARSTAEGVRTVLNRMPESSMPEAVWITLAAAQLPGLLDAIALRLPERTTVIKLSRVAGAEAALALAVRRLRHELPSGDLNDIAPRFRSATASHPAT